MRTFEEFVNESYNVNESSHFIVVSDKDREKAHKIAKDIKPDVTINGAGNIDMWNRDKDSDKIKKALKKAGIKYNVIFESEEDLQDYKQILWEGAMKFNGRTVKDIKKKTKSPGFLVQDADGEEWSITMSDAKDNDSTVWGMAHDGDEKEINIDDITFIMESETSEYEPPKYLISPALDPDTQKPNDKMHAYMENELKKRKSYFKPGVKSAEPPKDVDKKEQKADK